MTTEPWRTAIPRRWELWLTAALGLYFAGRLIWLAAVIAPGVPPDETDHVALVQLYAHAPLLARDSPASYPHGLVSRVPYLYHLLMGKLSAVGAFGLGDLLYLRLLNAALALGTLAAGWRLAWRLSGDALVRLLFGVLASNTLMFTFLGAAVSYDNLVNLLAVLAVSSLTVFLAERRPTALTAFVAWNLLGALTKVTFLPLGAILLTILVAERRRHLAADGRALLASLGSRRPAALAATVLLAAALAANLWLYGSNLLHYGKPVPACDDVLALEACMENRIFARGWVLRQYRDGALSFEQAVAAAGRIAHPGDRDHALRLLRNERAWQQTRPRALPVWDYLGLVWRRAIEPTVFGIQGHASMLKGPWALLPYNLVLAAALLLFVRHARCSGDERPWCRLALVVLAYFVILVGIVNYRTYLITHAPLLGVQGRYLFPVLLPAWLVVARFLLLPWRRPWVRLGLAAAVAVVFLWGDLPYFLRHATEVWFQR